MSRYQEMTDKAAEVAGMLDSHFSGHVGVLLMKVLGSYGVRPPDNIDWRSKEGRAYRKAEKALFAACDDFTRARLNLPPQRVPTQPGQGRDMQTGKHMKTANQMREWRVVIQGIKDVGDIGSVSARTEDEARLAALSKFGNSGDRRKGSDRAAIYEDDDFDVRAS